MFLCSCRYALLVRAVIFIQDDAAYDVGQAFAAWKHDVDWEKDFEAEKKKEGIVREQKTTASVKVHAAPESESGPAEVEMPVLKS